MTTRDETAVHDQIRYYNARAEADDAWYQARGLWDMGSEANRTWMQEVKQARDELRTLLPTGRALDIACGSGVWTNLLAEGASHVVALDGAPSMLEKAKERLSAHDNVSYVCSDVFDYTPDQRFDFALITFWISHISAPLQSRFWDRVAAWLKPSATLFLVDHQSNEETDQPDSDSNVHIRSWEGRDYPVIKVPVNADDVNAALTTRGFSSHVRETGNLVLGPAFGTTSK